MKMTNETVFIRSPKKHNYSIIDNTCLRDPNLSWKAKGLFAYLLSLPDDWQIYQKDLVNRATDGDASLRSGIIELEKAGYLKRERQRNEFGQVKGMVYHIIENPNQQECSTNTTSEPRLENPIQENPIQENPIQENPVQENHTLVNTNKPNTKEQKTNIRERDKPSALETETNSISLAKQITLLDKKETKKQKKAREIVKMKDMILAFTTNQEVRRALTDYFNFRVGRGLTLKQWELILSDLREYAGTSASLAIEKINHALAGGYMTIIASWEKGKKAGRSKNTFDNTAGYEIEDADLSDEERFAKIEANLVRDENGNPIVF